MKRVSWWLSAVGYFSVVVITGMVGIGYVLDEPELRRWFGTTDMAHPTATVITVLALLGLANLPDTCLDTNAKIGTNDTRGKDDRQGKRSS